MIPLQQIDADFMAWLAQNRLPFVIVYTKTDRMKQTDLGKNLHNIRTALAKQWEELPQQFITSAEKGSGRNHILTFIDGINETIG